jgi:hypothetical protein
MSLTSRSDFSPSVRFVTVLEHVRCSNVRQYLMFEVCDVHPNFPCSHLQVSGSHFADGHSSLFLFLVFPEKNYVYNILILSNILFPCKGAFPGS